MYLIFVRFYFINVDPPHGEGTTVCTGMISPLVDIVQISYKVMGAQIEYVGNQHFAYMPVNTVFNIEVPVANKGTINCKIEVPQVSTNYVETIITGLKKSFKKP